MKNPFRTRYAVQAHRNTLPECLRLNGEPASKWCIVYRKWWQRKWRYAEMEYTGFGYTKMPVFYNSKEEAINSNTRITLTDMTDPNCHYNDDEHCKKGLPDTKCEVVGVRGEN